MSKCDYVRAITRRTGRPSRLGACQTSSCYAARAVTLGRMRGPFGRGQAASPRRLVLIDRVVTYFTAQVLRNIDCACRHMV